MPPLRLGEHVVEDYRRLTLSLKVHPVLFLRESLARRRILRSDELERVADGRRVAVVGLVLVRQRPGSAHGTVFLTLEDETGAALSDLARADEVRKPQTFEAAARGQGAELGAKIGFPLAADGRRQPEEIEAARPLAVGDVRRAMPKGRNFQ